MDGLISAIEGIRDREIFGRVAGVQGLLVEVAGPVQEMSVGSRLEVTGFGDAASAWRWSASAASGRSACRSERSTACVSGLRPRS